MNERQKRFADKYIKTGNGYQSAIKADYSKNHANNRITELLGNVGIKDYISKLDARADKNNTIQVEATLSILSDIARGKRELK